MVPFKNIESEKPFDDFINRQAGDMVSGYCINLKFVIGVIY